MADVITRFKVDLTDYDGKLKRAKSSMSGFSKQASADFARMGASIQASLGPLAAITAAAAAFKKVTGDMVTMNREFEQSNANLAAVLGESRENITNLTNDAKKLGATTMFTASQVTQLQTELAKLGFSQGEIKNATGDVLNLAAATGTDLATAAAQAGATMRGFGMQATEMDRVASVLAVSTTKSALSMEKLGVALPVVQTTAAKTGFTLEDTVAMLGKLVDNGINAASAGTQLRKVMNDASTAGTKLANFLGGPVHSLDELSAALNKASKEGMTHADSVALVNSKNATALDILRDMSVATDGSTSAMQDLRNQLTGCNDELQKMVDTQMDTFEGSVKTLSSAWEGLMLSFSNSNGFLKSIIDELTIILQKWTRMRNLNNGGASAIAEYENGANKEGAKAIVSGFRAGGVTDSEISAKLDDQIKKSEKDRDDAMGLLQKFETAAKKRETDYSKLYAELRERFGANAAEDGNGLGWLQKFIAGRNDKIATDELAKGMLTTGTTTTGATNSGDEDPVKSQIKRLRAQEAAQIASLDRKAMNEADYEDKVYEIKRNSLLKQQRLYDEESDQFVDYSTRLSNLDIQYQGTVLRRDKKQAKADAKYNTEIGTSGWSQANLQGMQSDLQKQMAGMQIGSEEYMAAMANSIDITTFQNLINEAMKNGVTIAPDTIESIFEPMFNGENIPDEVWTELADYINDQLATLGIKPIKVDVKTGAVDELNAKAKGTEAAWTSAAQAVGQLGSAVSSLGGEELNIAGVIAQAIANVALGLGQALSTKNHETVGPWDWIAAAISGTATMIGTIASIKSATSGYANGGLVLPNGSPFQGDNIVARLNAGEGVLTQQGIANAAALADGSGFGALTLRTEVSGESLAIVLDNNNRRRGRGKTIR